MSETSSPASPASPVSPVFGWNFADVWEVVAERIPDAPAQWHLDRVTSWAAFDQRADGIAHTLLTAGAQPGDKVAHYLYNCPEYLESMFGLFKASLVPVNTNYRYTDDELVYIWDNSDAVAVVFHGSFTERCGRIRLRVPAVTTWIWVDDATAECPPWAIPYEQAAVAAPVGSRVRSSRGRSGDDMLFMYTGGTTGFPKGVMWRQDDLLAVLDAANRKRLPPEQDLSAVGERTAAAGPRNLPAAPLMHGTGQFNAMSNLIVGGSIVTLPNRSFDPHALLDGIEQYKVNSMSIVGDAFAKPLLRALDAEPERWDISTLRVLVSSGVIWAAETKAGLLRHNPRLIMVDSLGSSEAIGMASNTTSADSTERATTATFVLGANAKVLTEDGREVMPGSGERGRVALRGRTPVGYYKDEAKSAATFITYEGVRYSIPGDWAEVDADGTVRLLGRGSQCINTGGEKVYPEEVEEALKLHASVLDAAVVGVPDERFGEAITALVELNNGATLDTEALIAHVRQTLAAFKSPKRIFQIDSIGRAANGKLDYKALKERALAALSTAD